ncbi:MAG: hypothetical protein QE273_16635 [Verrucomicrobiales bacterium]|nr:hypothetical protein [Verrucomicrobiales bacterium]
MSAIPILGLLFGLATSVLPAMAQKQIDLPEQTGILIGSSVRGYWFTAPKDFAITGVEVPTDASEGNQSIAVVRFTAEPPLFDSYTNEFEVLFLTQNDSATGMIPTYLEIASGDVIGVLGSRDGVNSLAPVGPSSIDGLPINLRSLGMQFPLVSTAPQNLWTDEGDSISRVRLFYGPVYDPMIAESSPPKRNLKKKKKQRRSGIRPPRAVTPY